MKSLSPEILRGIVGGAFLMRTLEGVPSLIMMPVYASKAGDQLYAILIPSVAILASAPITVAYLFSYKRAYIHWIAIAVLVLAILVSGIGLIAFSGSHPIRGDMRITAISSAAIKVISSSLLLYFVFLIKNKERQA